MDDFNNLAVQLVGNHVFLWVYWNHESVKKSELLEIYTQLVLKKQGGFFLTKLLTTSCDCISMPYMVKSQNPMDGVRQIYYYHHLQTKDLMNIIDNHQDVIACISNTPNADYIKFLMGLLTHRQQGMDLYPIAKMFIFSQGILKFVDFMMFFNILPDEKSPDVILSLEEYVELISCQIQDTKISNSL